MKRRLRCLWAGTVSADNVKVRGAETVKHVEVNLARTATWRGAGEPRGVGDPMHACKPTTGTWEVFIRPRAGAANGRRDPKPEMNGVKKSDEAIEHVRFRRKHNRRF